MEITSSLMQDAQKVGQSHTSPLAHTRESHATQHASTFPIHSCLFLCCSLLSLLSGGLLGSCLLSGCLLCSCLLCSSLLGGSLLSSSLGLCCASNGCAGDSSCCHRSRRSCCDWGCG